MEYLKTLKTEDLDWTAPKNIAKALLEGTIFLESFILNLEKIYPSCPKCGRKLKCALDEALCPGCLVLERPWRSISLFDTIGP